MEGWMDEQTNGREDGWPGMDERMDDKEWITGWMKGWTESTDNWMKRWLHSSVFMMRKFAMSCQHAHVCHDVWYILY